MKRWPILLSFVLFVGLCMSITFWALQFFKPAVRPVAAPKQELVVEVNPEAAIGLFGGRPVAVAAASNFQLKGVVVSKNPLESVAILEADGKPAEAIRVNAEVVPGTTVKEVHSQYVLLADGGVVKRVELPATAPHSGPESPVGPGTSMQPAQQVTPQMNAELQPQVNPPGIEPSPPPPPPPQNMPPGRIGRGAARGNINANRN